MAYVSRTSEQASIFPPNNLPADSKVWGQNVEKRVYDLETNLAAAEVNNITRDSQLISSYERLDSTITQLAATNAAVDEAQSDAITALQAANTANGNALNALQDIIDLSSPGGPTINASNITAGTIDASQINVTNLNADNITSGSINADRISGGTIDASEISVINLSANSITTGSFSADRIAGGTIDASDISGVNINGTTITGGTINGTDIIGVDITGTSTITGAQIFGSSFTTSGTRRVELVGSNANFYDQNGDFTGKIIADGLDRAGTIQVQGPGTGVLGVWNEGVYMNGNGGVQVDVAGGYLNVSAGSFVVTNGGIEANNANIHVNNGALTTSGVTIGASNITASSGTVSAGALSSSGGLTVSGNSDLQGRIISAGTYNAVASSTANVLINTNNYFQRTTSSRRYKSDIQDIDYGMAGLNLQPRSWVDKAAYEENGNSTEGLTRITGFIAEEIHDLGLTELVQYNEDGLPEAVNYDRMLVAVIPILKQQQQTIDALTARLEALEGRVQ